MIRKKKKIKIDIIFILKLKVKKLFHSTKHFFFKFYIMNIMNIMNILYEYTEILIKKIFNNI